MQPRGRPAAAALSAFVSAAAAAFVAGHAVDSLELYISEFGSCSRAVRDGPRLTSGEASYRRLWLCIVHETLRRRGHPSRGAAAALADVPPAVSPQVAAVLAAAAARAPHAAKLDRSLATRGASDGNGTTVGTNASAQTLAPQWVPLSQLVLLTCQVRGRSHRFALAMRFRAARARVASACAADCTHACAQVAAEQSGGGGDDAA